MSRICWPRVVCIALICTAVASAVYTGTITRSLIVWWFCCAAAGSIICDLTGGPRASR